MAPETMTVIEAKGHGGPDVLVPAKRPVPVPGPGEVLIEVKAAGVNRPDVLQRQGLYPAPKGASDLLGLEVAGNVAACGPGAARYKIGDAVCALTNGGGYAEFCVAPESATLPLPDGLSPSRQRRCQRPCSPCGTTCSSAAASSQANGCSCMAERAASAPPRFRWDGCSARNVLVTAGSAEKVRACEELGATRAINYREEDFVEVVKEATQGHGADVILDMVGGDYIERDLRAAAIDGRIVQIAFLKTSKVEIDLMRLMMRRLTLTGSTLRAQSAEAKARMARAIEEKVWPLIAEGKLKPVIDSTFALTDAAAAHARIDDPDHIGKIVLVVD